MSILTCVTQAKLRITIVGLNYAPEPTGIAPYTSRLAEILVEQGHHVHVLTGYPHYPEWKLKDGYSGWQRKEWLSGVPLTRLRHFIPTRNTTLQRLLLELSFGVRAVFSRWYRPDAVLIVSPALFSSALVLMRAKFGFRRPPTGLWIQDIYTRGVEETGAGSSKASKTLRRVESVILRSASLLTVIHDRFKDYLVTELCVPAERVTTIRNWTHVQVPTSVDRASTRAQHGWGDNDFIVLHAGNMGVKQGLGNVVAAASLADKSDSKIRFVLLGDGNQRRHIQELARDVSHIEFIPPVPDEQFSALLHAADALLVNEMRGLREMAVPSKLTSYFSTGLPVVAATEKDSTTASEIERSGGGLRVDPDSPEELLRVCEQLSGDKITADVLGQAGTAYAAKFLTQDAAIVQYSIWLQQLAAHGSCETAGAANKHDIKSNNAGGKR